VLIGQLNKGGEIIKCNVTLLVAVRNVGILRTQNFAQNLPPCAEFGVLHRLEENLPNGAENAKILLIFVNPFTYNS